MGISTQTITVDLSKQLTRPQVVRLGQGDKLGTTLVADVYENGVAYNLTGKTARFSMRAPDGASSYSVTASSTSGNKATFDIDETYAASIAGKTDTAYIEVLSGSTVICSTSRITVIVYRSASQGLPVSGAYSDALEEAIDAANAAIEAMGDISELAVPEMTASVRGGAKLGTGLAVVDGTLGVDLSNVDTGTLPVARGGTGVATAEAERIRLGLGGDHVLAGSDDQAVFGRFNVLDEDDAYAVIIGNGTAGNSRSNALTVGWDGSVDMAGMLKVTGNEILYNSAFDLAYNATINATAERAMFVKSSDDETLAAFRGRQDADGRKRAIMEARGPDADGNDVWCSIACNVSKTGVRSYTVTDPAAFCSALHVGDLVSSNGASISVANSTYKDLGNFTLAAGTWIVMAAAEFQVNATGRRVIVIGTAAGDSDLGLMYRATSPAISGGVPRLKLQCVVQPTAPTTYYLNAWQDSGSTLTAAYAVQAVRIA